VRYNFGEVGGVVCVVIWATWLVVAHVSLRIGEHEDRWNEWCTFDHKYGKEWYCLLAEENGPQDIPILFWVATHFYDYGHNWVDERGDDPAGRFGYRIGTLLGQCHRIFSWPVGCELPDPLNQLPRGVWALVCVPIWAT
jgi:hypothetical protein